jgi:hypothetical protein
MNLLQQETLESRVSNLEKQVEILKDLLTKNKRGPPNKKHILSNNITIKENIHLLKVFNNQKIWIVLYNKDQKKDIPILETDINSLIVLRNALMNEDIVGYDSYKLINRFAMYDGHIWSLSN